LAQIATFLNADREMVVFNFYIYTFKQFKEKCNAAEEECSFLTVSTQMDDTQPTPYFFIRLLHTNEKYILISKGTL